MTTKIDPTNVMKTVQDAVEQTRATFESFTKASSEAAQQSYHQIFGSAQTQMQKATVDAQKGYEELAKFQKETLDAVTESGQLFAKGAEAMGKRAATFAQGAMEQAMAHAKSLMSAKNVNDVMELHTSFLKQTYEKTVAEANALQTMGVKLANESIVPIKSKAEAAVTKFVKAA